MVIGKGKLQTEVNPTLEGNQALDREGFLGVDPVYQNFANDTDKPLEGRDGETAAERGTGSPEGEGSDLNPAPTTSTDPQPEHEKADAENETLSSSGAGQSDLTSEQKAEQLAANDPGTQGTSDEL